MPRISRKWPRVSWRALGAAMRRRAYRKRLAVGRRGRLQSTVYRYKRTVFVERGINSDPLANQFYGIGFSLSAVTSHTEFTALYDQYKIEKVRYTLMPRQTVTTGVGAGQVASAPVFSVIDYDDANTPTSIAQLMQYQNLKTTKGMNNHTRVLKPGVQLQTQNVGGAASFGKTLKSPWLDCADDTVQHNAIKLALQAPTGGVSISYDIKIEYFLAFKNVR